MALILIFRRPVVWVFILFALGISFSTGAFSMFNSKQKPSKELFDILQSAEATNIYANNQGFNISNLYIEKARIKGAKIHSFSVSNTDLNNFDARNSQWSKGKFYEVNFNQSFFDEIELTNVIFEKSNLNEVNFISATLKNVKFIDCTITKSALYYLKDSDIEFVNTKIFDNEYKFSDSQIRMRLIDSEFRNTDMMSLKEGSSLYIENSVIDKVSFQYSNLEYIKAKNSKILNSSASDSTIHEIEISNSELKFSFGRSKLEKINVTSSNLQKFGMVKITADSVNILDCSDISKTSFAKANIGSIYIKNCDFSEIYPAFLNADRLEINNSKILETAFIESKISNLVLKDITFTKEADFTGFKADSAKFDNITKGPDLKIIMNGANIEF